MANSPKDDTDLPAIPLKKLDAILNQIQKQNALISEQGSQINELSTENEKLRSLLARANEENKRRNEIVEGFKSMLFKVGQTSEAGIVVNSYKALNKKKFKNSLLFRLLYLVKITLYSMKLKLWLLMLIQKKN